MHSTVQKVTNRIIERSRASRADYLERMAGLAAKDPHRGTLSCGNLAHGFAACFLTLYAKRPMAWAR